jgi:hypothetical protein
MEEEIKDLETNERKEAEKSFWDSETNDDEFLKMQSVIDNEIKAIKLLEYKGLVKTRFKQEGKENTLRPNFKVEVISGKNKGAKYVISLSIVSARKLEKDIKDKDFKHWEGKLVNVAIAQKGDFKGIDYSLYIPLVV